jgi:predicted enzyme related to lactoylglutathione lyase
MSSKPAIVAPVSRSIHVSDAARSSAFYRDVLGFQVREMEATYGPACIEFGGEGGPAILFFETDNVEAMHAAIRARGGAPSELERVNFIKFRVFEIRDPDGNTLWFGQSFHQPDQPRPKGLLEKALPELPFNDVAAAIAYYQEVLGFRINYAQHDLGVMERDEVTILLIQRTERHTGIGSVGFYIEDADKLYAELQAKGAHLQGEPVSWPWGLRNFQVLDPEGNRLTFSQPFE